MIALILNEMVQEAYGPYRVGKVVEVSASGYTAIIRYDDGRQEVARSSAVKPYKGEVEE